MQQRLTLVHQFYAAIRPFRADQLVFIDESHVDNRVRNRVYGRAPRGEPAVVMVDARRGVRVNIIAAVSLDGFIAQDVFTGGTCDAERFYHFLRHVLVSFVIDVFI